MGRGDVFSDVNPNATPNKHLAFKSRGGQKEGPEAAVRLIRRCFSKKVKKEERRGGGGLGGGGVGVGGGGGGLVGEGGGGGGGFFWGFGSVGLCRVGWGVGVFGGGGGVVCCVGVGGLFFGWEGFDCCYFFWGGGGGGGFWVWGLGGGGGLWGFFCVMFVGFCGGGDFVEFWVGEGFFCFVVVLVGFFWGGGLFGFWGAGGREVLSQCHIRAPSPQEGTSNIGSGQAFCVISMYPDLISGGKKNKKEG